MVRAVADGNDRSARGTAARRRDKFRALVFDELLQGASSRSFSLKPHFQSLLRQHFLQPHRRAVIGTHVERDVVRGLAQSM
jgi:hypothetical protein